jgi:tetratricopeptide (TPR) repeat protein
MLIKQTIRAATGWLELGMPADALEELKSLSLVEQGQHRAMELKLAAEMAMMMWKDASATALKLCEQASDEPDFFLSAAYCLHEMGSTVEARNCLENGPASLHELPVFHYNMACYLWKIGDQEPAKQYLMNAISMDENFLEAAKVDKDLVGLDIGLTNSHVA